MTRRRLFVPIAAALIGIPLFIYAVRDAGWSNVVDGVRSVGWWMLAILALSGLRFVLRAAAWQLCIPPQHQFSFGQAFAAFLSGDAVGNVTPLGLFASEPTKVFLIRHRLATREAAASLAVDFVIYSTSAVTMIAVGLTLLLTSVNLSLGTQEIVVAALAVIGVGVFFVLRMMGRTSKTERDELPGWRGRIDAFRESVTAFSAGHPARLWQIFGLDLLFHAVAVLEVYLTLSLLRPEPPTVVEAVMFGALDRAIMIVFKFIPLRAGVDEIFSGGMAGLLGWPALTGVVLALIRKVRSLFWMGVGLLLIAAHPSPAEPATDPL
ncbi:MAG TPA: lysylphosphatidylglycerol synthase domain-containing protein [Gemmatimonadaceae bacterium]